MSRPLILDLFCGAGGAGMGYHRAGFAVVGVDINPQPNYPFQFVQADAIEYLREALREGGFPGEDRVVAVHASPPCQAHTTMSNRWRGKGGKADDHVDLIGATRDLLIATGLPYVIENVPGAKRMMRSPVVLHGGMFDLGVHRPRLFETNWPLLVAYYRFERRPTVGVYGQRPDGRLLMRYTDGGEQRAARSLEEGRAAMGIDWMGWRELAESIPPAYTHHIGLQLAGYLSANKETPSSDVSSGCC